MKHKFLKVVDRKDLIRETDSKALLNTDLKELNKYKEERIERMRLKQIVDENEDMKRELQEIKSLLKALIGQK